MAEIMQTPVVKPWVVSPEEEQAFQTTDASFAWLCQLTSEHIRQFAGKWLAVQDCRVVASGDTLEGLREHFKDGDLTRVIVHRVERPGKVIFR